MYKVIMQVDVKTVLLPCTVIALAYETEYK
jgi:hypothetical protein